MTPLACSYRHTLFGLVFAIVGMLLGIFMASTHDHAQHVTHAHVLLLGLVVSLLYASVLRLWLVDRPASALLTVQLLLHQFGTVVLTGGLFALYGGLAPEPLVGPVLGIASLAVLGGTVLMLVIFMRASRQILAAEHTAPPGRTAIDNRAPAARS